MGRSIGTGIALELMQKIKPGALVLISPFASIKSLAREFAGFFGQLVAKESFDNRNNIKSVSCPTFFLHGLKDQTISAYNTKELASMIICYPRTLLSKKPSGSNPRHDPFKFRLLHWPSRPSAIIPDGPWVQFLRLQPEWACGSWLSFPGAIS